MFCYLCSLWDWRNFSLVIFLMDYSRIVRFSIKCRYSKFKGHSIDMVIFDRNPFLQCDSYSWRIPNGKADGFQAHCVNYYKLMGFTQLIRLPCPNEFILGFNSKIVLLYSKNYHITTMTYRVNPWGFYSSTMIWFDEFV